MYDPEISLDEPLQVLEPKWFKSGMQDLSRDWITSACSLDQWLLLGHYTKGFISILKYCAEKKLYEWIVCRHKTNGNSYLEAAAHMLQQSVDRLFWFGEKMCLEDDETLYIVWSIHRHAQVVRYTLPINCVRQYQKEKLMVTDPD